MGGLFDGPGAGLAARIMARANAPAEGEAIARLDPPPGARVLVLGYGPGVGVARLAQRLPEGFVLGVDPSAAMLKSAARRNRAAIGAGRVRLELAHAHAIPAPAADFDAAIAVNTLQLCEPLAATMLELARVLRPGGRLVSLTHDWAMARHAGSSAAWLDQAQAAFALAGFVDFQSLPAQAERGRSIAVLARRP